MKNTLLNIVGFVALSLGVVGAFLPVMPTTCFVLLAAGCFAKSSPYWHQRLLHHPLLGNIITTWENERYIPPKARWTATLSIIVFGILSFATIDNITLRVLLVMLMASGLTAIYWFSKPQTDTKVFA